MHDLYPTNASQYNAVQALNLGNSRLKIPFIQYGEVVWADQRDVQCRKLGVRI
jgi:hypothetical protein